MTMAHGIDRFLRLNEVMHITGLGRNTVYRRIREETFPRQTRIGANSVAWRQSEIDKWMLDPFPLTDVVATARLPLQGKSAAADG